MMKSFLKFSFVMVCFGNLSVAYSKECRRLDDRSCWHAVNNSEKNSLSISCSSWGGTSIYFGSPNVEPKKIYSEQYDRGWGDGLGFPEPGINVSCEFLYPGKKAHVFFTTKDWGERAKFEVSEKEVVLTMRGWAGSQQNAKFPMVSSR